VWAKKGERPVVLTTGSHKKTCIFGALSMSGRQLFRQYDRINQETLLRFLKELRRKYGRFLLFWDKYLHRDKRMKEFMKENKGRIKAIYFPNATPELNPVEECWKQCKNAIVANKIYPGFEEMRRAVSEYLRKRRFKLDVVKYLSR
jgi:transposase